MFGCPVIDVSHKNTIWTVLTLLDFVGVGHISGLKGHSKNFILFFFFGGGGGKKEKYFQEGSWNEWVLT